MEDLRPASFRGVPFSVRNNDLPLGRRVAITTFPFRPDAEDEDFDRKIPVYSFRAFVIGADYETKRDNLIAAINKKGRGELIHPNFGAKNVTVTGASVSHDSSALGMATFDLEFTETGNENTYIAPDTQVGAIIASNDLTQSAKAKIIGDLNTNGPEWIGTNVGTAINNAQRKMDELTTKFTANVAPFNLFLAKSKTISNSLLTLAKSPSQIALKVSDLINQFSQLIKSPQEAIAILGQLSRFGKSIFPSSGNTKAQNQSIQNTNLVNSLVAQVAVSECIKIVADWDFETYDDAVNARISLVELIDELSLNAADTGNYDAWDAYEAARIAIIKDIDARGSSLPRAIAYKVQFCTPAIVIAHQIYGAQNLESRFEDMVTRNKILDPLFVPEGIELAVVNV